MNVTERAAVLSAALRYRDANGGVLSNRAVTVLADRFEVSGRTIRRMVKAAAPTEETPGGGVRAAFEFDKEGTAARTGDSFG